MKGSTKALHGSQIEDCTTLPIANRDKSLEFKVIIERQTGDILSLAYHVPLKQHNFGRMYAEKEAAGL